MEVRILDVYASIDYETERGMVIPCSPYGLAIKKSDNMETGKCPICGKRIYMTPDGVMGHDVDEELINKSRIINSYFIRG